MCLLNYSVNIIFIIDGNFTNANLVYIQCLPFLVCIINNSEKELSVYYQHLNNHRALPIFHVDQLKQVDVKLEETKYFPLQYKSNRDIGLESKIGVSLFELNKMTTILNKFVKFRCLIRLKKSVLQSKVEKWE